MSTSNAQRPRYRLLVDQIEDRRLPGSGLLEVSILHEYLLPVDFGPDTIETIANHESYQPVDYTPVYCGPIDTPTGEQEQFASYTRLPNVRSNLLAATHGPFLTEPLIDLFLSKPTFSDNDIATGSFKGDLNTHLLTESQAAFSPDGPRDYHGYRLSSLAMPHINHGADVLTQTASIRRENTEESVVAGQQENENPPLTNGCMSTPVTPWDPDIKELPRAVYHYETVTFNPQLGYYWGRTFPFPPAITSVRIAPPRHPTAYVLYQDYYGDYYSAPCNRVDLFFSSPGAYAVKVSFSDNSSYTTFLYVETTVHESRKLTGAKAQARAVYMSPPTFSIFPNRCMTSHRDVDAGDRAIMNPLGFFPTNQVHDVYAAIAYFQQNSCQRVTLSGHGANSYYGFGPGMHGAMEDNDKYTQTFTANLRGQVSLVNFFGCEVAKELDTYGNNHLMKATAIGLYTPTTPLGTWTVGWDVCTMVVGARFWRSGYYAYEEGGRERNFHYVGG